MSPEEWETFICGHPAVLAPLAGVSDAVMRRLCIEQGAQVAFTEMVSAKGLSYNNERTHDLVALAPNEERVGVQLFGHEPDVMAREAARLRDELGDSLLCIDVNMGCPVRKVVQKGEGAALMREPGLAAAIVAAVASAVDVPVTAKMRLGWSQGEELAPGLAQRLEQAGAAGVAVHGRFATQMYRGQADWAGIARVVAAVGIPVVGNGDVASGADALRMMGQTGCAAVMVGRAALGNPWVFASLRAAFAGEPAPPAPTPAERIRCARRHAHLLSQMEPRALLRMRKLGSWYCKGLPGATRARALLNSCATLDDFDAAFDAIDAMLLGTEGKDE